MQSLSVVQMREADRRCIEELGIPGAVLMHNAGAAVFRAITQGPVGVVCGKGNNGGDGYVVARLALLAGLETHAVLTATPEEVRGDAAIFLNAYRRLGGKLTCASTEAEAARAVRGLAGCAVLVDALLGTGIQGEVRGVARAAINAWPDLPTIAVDVPSGLDADTGRPCGCCVRAWRTITFQFKKRGFDKPDALDYLGQLEIADIGIPDVCADDEAWRKLRAEWRT